jgi:hypothetical protein
MHPKLPWPHAGSQRDRTVDVLRDDAVTAPRTLAARALIRKWKEPVIRCQLNDLNRPLTC